MTLFWFCILRCASVVCVSFTRLPRPPQAMVYASMQFAQALSKLTSLPPIWTIWDNSPTCFILLKILQSKGQWSKWLFSVLIIFSLKFQFRMDCIATAFPLLWMSSNICPQHSSSMYQLLKSHLREGGFLTSDI